MLIWKATKMSKFIELTKLCYDAKLNKRPGERFTVNAEHITSFRPEFVRSYGDKILYGTEVEYLGDAGYGTRRTLCEESYDTVKALVEKAS